MILSRLQRAASRGLGSDTWLLEVRKQTLRESRGFDGGGGFGVWWVED